MFGVLATGFSVLLGFIIFLAFSSYDESRQGADRGDDHRPAGAAAQFLPDDAAELTGELTCYARSVVGTEWDALNKGNLGNAINPWGAEMFRTISTVDPTTNTAVGVRQVDGPDRRPRAGTDRPRARRRGSLPVRSGWPSS